LFTTAAGAATISFCRIFASASTTWLSASNETVRKPHNRFSTSTFKYEMKAEAVKPDTKINKNLQNIENFKNELIQAELYRTRSVYEKSIRNIDP
jgi:hypothetical protein